MKYISWDKAKKKWRVSTPKREGAGMKAQQKRFHDKKDAIDWLNNWLRKNEVPRIVRPGLKSGKVVKCCVCGKKIYRSKSTIESQKRFVCSRPSECFNICMANLEGVERREIKKVRKKRQQATRSNAQKNRKKRYNNDPKYKKIKRSYYNKYFRDILRPRKKWGQMWEAYPAYRDLMVELGDKRFFGSNKDA